ncbi:hypothetical protein H6G65_15610 [Microcystis elabens FACHB-917]|nr:hypothetical protein [Microcystis elabens FACHB-917]
MIIVARAMNLQFPWSAGLILLLTPRFIGDSFFNIKDIPFAFFYLLYSTSLFLRLRRPLTDGSPAPARLLLFSALAAGLLGSLKIVALVPVLISEVLVTLIFPRRCRWIDGLHIGIDSFLLTLIFTPSSWLEPLRFLNSAVKLFRSHDWPGGTWWHGEFLSRVQAPLQWSTGGYLLRWIPSTTPLWILLLALCGSLRLLRAASRSWLWREKGHLVTSVVSGSRRQLRLFFPFALQLLLLPSLAIVGNSNLYDGVRHILFIYPPLALLAAFGLDRFLSVAGSLGPGAALRTIGLVGLALMATLTLVDELTLFPYAYVYVNEPMRFFLSPANTAYDYWVYAGTDAARGALRLLPSAPSAPNACVARTELPDPTRAMLAPSLREASCAPPSSAAAMPTGQPLVLRLVSGSQATQPLCSSVTRWQWPWFRRTLASACLDPLQPKPLS